MLTTRLGHTEPLTSMHEKEQSIPCINTDSMLCHLFTLNSVTYVFDLYFLHIIFAPIFQETLKIW